MRKTAYAPLACMLFALILAVVLPLQALASILTVTFIDVGQGDAALVACEGSFLLVDAGPGSSEERLLAALDALGVKALDYAVATHPHEDHIGGLAAVLRALPVTNLWMPRVEHDTETFENLLLTIQSLGLTVHAPAPGETFSLGDSAVTVLAPLAPPYGDLNDYSLVLRVDHGSRSFLLAGDASARSEGEMLAAGAPLSADVLKVGHHGSATSSTPAFLGAVEPKAAVISCGAGNRYGHPARATLDALEAVGAMVFRTDEEGSVTLVCDGESLMLCTNQMPKGDAYALHR